MATAFIDKNIISINKKNSLNKAPLRLRPLLIADMAVIKRILNKKPRCGKIAKIPTNRAPFNLLGYYF